MDVTSFTTTPRSPEQRFSVDETDPRGRARAPAGRARVLRPHDPAQQLLIPTRSTTGSLQDHPARCVEEAADELIAVDAISSTCGSLNSVPPDHLAMMLKVLAWGYSCRVTSSPAMERRCSTEWPSGSSRRIRTPTTAQSLGSVIVTSSPRRARLPVRPQRSQAAPKPGS